MYAVVKLRNLIPAHVEIVDQSGDEDRIVAEFDYKGSKAEIKTEIERRYPNVKNISFYA